MSGDSGISDGGTPVTERTMVLLFNRDGPPGQGGLDLEMGAQTDAADPDADVRDTGIDLSSPVNQDWRRRIGPINGTELRSPASGVVYDDLLTSEQVVSAFNDGQPLAESNEVQVGDMFSARTAGGNHYILTVTGVTVTPSDNSDFYEFSVKN